MRPPRWAVAAAALRPRTVRLRLTALYGALFLVCGAALLTVTYLLVEHSNSLFAVTTTDGGAGVVVGGGKGGATQGTLSTTSTPGGVAPPDLPSPEQMRALALRQHARMMHQLLLDSGIALAVTAVLAIGLGWVVAGRVLRPLRTITAAARDISATNLHRRLALSGPRDELTELGDTFDDLLARLETAFEARRRFVANASHELRTPLARQRAIGQVALADPQPTLGSLRVAHERVLVAGAQQERLIAGLLALARGQAGVEHAEPLDLAVLVDHVLAARTAEAELRGILVEAELRPAVAVGDPRLLESLTVNLVENGLRHNESGGWLEVSTATRDDRAVLIVRNSGPLVPADAIDQLLQPFRRLAGERAASGDGLGIGLSIVQAVCDAHGADLRIEPGSDGGLVVRAAFAVSAQPTVTCTPSRSASARTVVRSGTASITPSSRG